jgi:hypothetical protein
VTIVYRTINGRPFQWSEGTGWLEIEDSSPSASQLEDQEALMRGRTPEEAESGRRALAKRAARRRPSPTVSTTSAVAPGYLAASRPRRLERTTLVEGGVTAT